MQQARSATGRGKYLHSGLKPRSKVRDPLQRHSLSVTSYWNQVCHSFVSHSHMVDSSFRCLCCARPGCTWGLGPRVGILFLFSSAFLLRFSLLLNSCLQLFTALFFFGWFLCFAFLCFFASLLFCCSDCLLRFSPFEFSIAALPCFDCLLFLLLIAFLCLCFPLLFCLCASLFSAALL